MTVPCSCRDVTSQVAAVMPAALQEAEQLEAPGAG
jgi:hypothetical protein